ncbi:2-dehydropantoate 2-reductase [Paenibacillus sp. JX-17]|uniref:2-dehydropantoate 2-reductase n=1 Tax=Paenibacillus lacisoli TaxID=3064525 RepID=A0ABT9C854_9BACL|nr:2-dehydropantoate 2-reductase [Paenibacillus sp. JX-17]MDO7905422.1 2-dehydropantoate 2-reductase [Paenibacillus sp. JX-17]
MIIDIVGAGSLGLLYSGKLAAAGTAVRLWTRSAEQAQQLQGAQLIVRRSDGQTESQVTVNNCVLQTYALNEMKSVQKREQGDWLLLAVKQKDVAQAASELSRSDGKWKGIVCLQNGVGHMETIQRLLPELPVYAAVTTEGAAKSDAGIVIHAGLGETVIGLWEDSSIVGEEWTRDHLINLVSRLEQAGFRTSLSNEIERMVYRKLIINAVINPLTAVWRIRNGELLDSETRTSLMQSIYNESIRILKACNLPWEEGWWDEVLNVCRRTADNISSMHSDVAAGRTTEISSINGGLISLADRAGIEAPLNRLMLQIIEGMQSGEE